MIAIDTNVLVRYLVTDDPEQSEVARKFIEDGLSAIAPGFVSLVVLVELDWVLRSGYRFSPTAIAEIFQRLLTSPKIVFENAAAVGRALSQSRRNFADMLIHEVGCTNACTKTVTFDRKFARLDGVELLA